MSTTDDRVGLAQAADAGTGFGLRRMQYHPDRVGVTYDSTRDAQLGRGYGCNAR